MSGASKNVSHRPVKEHYTVGEIIDGIPCVCGGIVCMGNDYGYDEDGHWNGYDFECTGDEQV